jgi:hypothetical protein
LKLKNACGLLGRSSPSWCVLGVFRSGHPGSFVVNWNVDPLPQDWPLWISLATSSILSSGPGKTDQGQVRQHAPSMRWFVRFPLSSEASDTISTLIPVESAGSFGDGRCCHPSGYLQIALGLLTRSHQARLALSGPAIAGSIQAFPKALYCLAHHQNPFANSTRLIA